MLNLSICFSALSRASLALLFAENGSAAASEPQSVEVFTVAESPVDSGVIPSYGAALVEVYKIDGIDNFEEGISQGLPVSPESAKQIAIQRIGLVDQIQIQHIQRAALGLSKATQYGIERYPAIVFDGNSAVYGVTDLSKALDYYFAWKSGAPL